MTPSIIVALLSGAAAVGSVLVLIIKSRGENKNATLSAKSALDARIDARVSEQLTDAWTRIDLLEKNQELQSKRDVRRTSAMTRILRAIANQWPGPDGPKLDPSDIAEVEETIPGEWIHTKDLKGGRA